MLGIDRTELVETLEQVSGERFGDRWTDWVRWYAGTELTAPPSFLGWKGRLLARIDPAFGPLLAAGSPTRIRPEEIVWGGVAFEGIPALDDPKRVPAANAGVGPTEPVFGIAVDGAAMAYPLRILDWHEMANDTVGGVPIALAYCTLCGSGIAYDRRAPDGSTYDFGSSGFLMRSNKLMVDRQTRSLWNQFTGEPVLGPLAGDSPQRLRVLPSVVTSFEAWRERHPQTEVLSAETGHARPYEPGAAYADYFSSPRTMFPVERFDGPGPKDRIVGVERDGRAKAWPVDALVEQRVVEDQLGPQRLAPWSPRGAAIPVEGRSHRTGRPHRYDAGATVRVYGLESPRGFRLDGAGRLVDETGNGWEVTEEALIGPGAERLERIPPFTRIGSAGARSTRRRRCTRSRRRPRRRTAPRRTLQLRSRAGLPRPRRCPRTSPGSRTHRPGR